MSFNRSVIALSIVLLLCAPAVKSPPGAFANAGSGSTSCTNTGFYTNPSDTACINGHNGEIYTDVYTEITDNYLDAYADGCSSARHINNSMWLYTKTDLSQEVEMGNYYGYDCTEQGGWFPGGSTSEEAVVYWADNNFNQPLGSQLGYAHYITSFNRNDTVGHTLEIVRDSANPCYWDLYYDGQYSGQSHLQYCSGGTSYGYEQQVGLEYGDASNSTYASWPYANTATDGNLMAVYNGGWHDWPYMYTANTEPCTGSRTTNCFNGSNEGATTLWVVNRPRG